MPRPRCDILNVAKQCPGADLAILNLAEQPMTSADVSKKFAELENALLKAKRNRILSYFLVSGLFFVGVVWLNPDPDDPIIHIYLGLLFLSMIGIVMFHSIQTQPNRIKSVLSALHPIANTIACHEAAKFVKSKHSNVLDWRDCAINERGQLYGFDVEVMRCLYQMAQSDDLLISTHEACRIAHGVDPAAL